MNLAVFGATGLTGRAVVERALAAGHRVTAFVREPSRLQVQNPNLFVAQGEARDAAAVEAAVAGQEAVISVLGTGTLDPTTVLSEGTRNIIAAMERQGAKRLVAQLASGMITGRVSPPYANINAEHKRVLKLLQASTLDWVAVCPPTITEDPGTGQFRSAINAMPEPNTMKISRYDLADFLLTQLTDDRGLRQLVGVVG